MNLIVNGKSTKIKSNGQDLSLETMLKQLDFHPQLVVVEINGSIVNTQNLRNHLIQDGDVIEIVTIVGGGS